MPLKMTDCPEFVELSRTIPDGALLVDGAGKVLYGNPLGLKLLGLPENHDGRPNLLSGLAPGSILRSALEQALRTEGPSRSDVRLPISADPFIEKVYRVYASPAAPASEGEGRVLVIRDVTGEIQAESMRNELFLMIAHDMRGSLSIIEGGADIMSRLPDMPEKALRYARAMRAAGRTLSDMVKDVLNLNKMEAGLMALSPVPTSVNQTLAALREAHQGASETRGVALVDVPLETDVALAMDQPLIERVLANLVANALKFTPKGGRIELSGGAVDEDFVRFCVSDTGPGIPPEKRDFIFEKYGQLAHDKSRGFGLGLAMCRLAVELHGGRIWVESEQGKGSRFAFTVSRALKPKASNGP